MLGEMQELGQAQEQTIRNAVPMVIMHYVQYFSDLFADDFGKLPLPDYALVGARITTAIAGGVSVYLAGENLLNREHQILHDYPIPGRTIFLGINWTKR